jgi:hypothetical protein
MKETKSARRARILSELKEWIGDGDPETAHQEADKLLLELIDDEEITKAFEDITRWYA